ncbi:ribosome biogenesis GTPase YqeH [Fodinisporobacter ferrooxydans]|uniref:Ribosome biogenesis GTPase YqeH n=1 Tax=Fodinisporobacter ferrooxydans TaxID=2901836 RepID=A0ABY4CEJ4_9BACL|nr:ribosome biogenesis GTPase YqeH [Alicyclobacillaceae bacterium MYW30-H2]
MAEVTKEVCMGCGAALQTEDTHAPGYVPSPVMEQEAPICRRCFRIQHYNEISPVAIEEQTFRDILSSIATKRAVVVHVIDLFDFPGSVLPSLHRFIGNQPLIVVANKVDILPKQTSLDRVRDWLRDELHRLHLDPQEICLVSSKKQKGIGDIRIALERLAKQRDVYVAGVSNVGKSTLINALVSSFGERSSLLTTSRFPGTTLSVVEIPIPALKTKLVDTPGILTTHRISDVICPACLKDVTPNSEIRPKIYQLRNRQTLFLGGLARIDFVSGADQSFVCYVANSLHVHRTKLEQADDLYDRHVGELLRPPCGNCSDSLRDLVTHSFSMPKAGTRDVVISGIGWVAVKGQGAEIKVHVPRGIDVTIRKTLL